MWRVKWPAQSQLCLQSLRKMQCQNNPSLINDETDYDVRSWFDVWGIENRGWVFKGQDQPEGKTQPNLCCGPSRVGIFKQSSSTLHSLLDFKLVKSMKVLTNKVVKLKLRTLILKALFLMRWIVKNRLYCYSVTWNNKTWQYVPVG